MVSGEQYVATTGVELMPLWPAGSWDTPVQVLEYSTPDEDVRPQKN